MSNSEDNSEQDAPYEVGYKKPPIETRFGQHRQPERSGSQRSGRPQIDLKEAVNKPLRVRIGGRARKISADEAALRSQIKKALMLQVGAVLSVLDRFKRHGIFTGEQKRQLSSIIYMPKEYPLEFSIFMSRHYGPPPWDPAIVGPIWDDYRKDKARISAFAAEEEAQITSEELAAYIRRGGTGS